MDTFIKNSYDTTHFTIEDVDQDNACMYRTVAHALKQRFSSVSGESLLDVVLYIESMEDPSIYWTSSHSHSVEDWDSEDVTRALQEKAWSFLYEHRTEKLETYLPSMKIFELTLEELVQMTHECDMEEYRKTYQYFSGDEVEFYDSDGELEEDGPDRWGGFPEQCALSYLFRIPIYVYCAQKYDTNKNKIITGRIHGNRPEKNTRFVLCQKIGIDFLSESMPIHILWKRSPLNGDHYYVLYKKNV